MFGHRRHIYIPICQVWQADRFPKSLLERALLALSASPIGLREASGKRLGKPLLAFFLPRLPALSAIDRTGGHAKGSAGLIPSPALGERRHRSLARCLVAVRGQGHERW